MSNIPDRRLELPNAEVPRLIEIWLESLDDFAALAQELTDKQWRQPSGCPGWTTGDVVAHVLGLEAELHGEPITDYQPDFDSLPHVTNPFMQYTEVPVDYWRQRSRTEVTNALVSMIDKRRDDLATLPTDPDEPMVGVAGWTLPRRKMIAMRILDTWVHEQDLREGADLPGGQGTDPAWFTAAQFSAGLPKAWAKNASAPAGSTVLFDITGPGVTFTTAATVTEDGRGAFVDPADTDEPTVTMQYDWIGFSRLAAGRAGAIETARLHADLSGDADLGDKLLRGLAMTP